ncbi:MAG: RNA polymerase sigma factor [Pseudomonadota bacterium]
MNSMAQQMDRFLAEVEKQAYIMANMSVRNADDALDLVQESMMTMVTRYAAKPHDEWRPLFFRILQNKIRDFHRRATTRGKLFSLFTAFRNDDDERVEPDSVYAGRDIDQPDERVMLDGSRDQMLVALAELPERQRQAFIFRSVDGLSVAETAQAMRCTGGSVKTHYSRAVRRLREQLQDHWT